MGQGDAEVVRRLFDAVARRDHEAVMSLYDPEIDWDGSRHRWAEVMEGEARWRGHGGLRDFFRRYYEMWENVEETIDELIDAGEHVVVVVTTRARGRASGLEVEWAGHGSVWTVRDGRVAEVVWFPSREEALAAAGLDG